jgi:hypothetical protein
MNDQTAKEILRLYRPGTPDAGEPEYVEALKLVQQDENLRRWFEDQSATREIIRSRLKRIPVPEALYEQILSEHPRMNRVVSRRETFALAVFVTATLLICFTLFWTRPPRQAQTQDDLTAFQERIANIVLRAYPAMDIETNDVDAIHEFLTQHTTSGNYTLPEGLSKATAIGCVATSWRGQDVAMICFKSGRAMRPGQNSDVWLFIIDHAAISNAPESALPQIADVNRLATGTWTQNGKTYLLAVDGDEKFLKSYLQ